MNRTIFNFFSISLLVIILFIFQGSLNKTLAQVPPDYTGCQGISISNQCDWDEYNPDYCYDLQGDPANSNPYTRPVENEFRTTDCGGCFVQHPQLPAGQGVCILHKDTTFIGPAPDNAPPISAGDDNCPVCPDGYQYNGLERKCSEIGGTVSAPMRDIIRWDVCSADQTCEPYLNGAGCQSEVGGGCLNMGPSDSYRTNCGDEKPQSCSVGGDTYCCETLGQCVAAGGERTLCIPATELTPGTGPTSCAALYPDDFPQLCRTEDWDWITLEEDNYCCYSQDACDQLGGSDRGVVNDRTIGDYDICVSNLRNNGTNPDGSQGALDLCNECYTEDGIWTAIGCIDQDPKSMISKLITIGTGIVGGVFLLRVLAAAFMLTTSQGDVKKTSEAKEMITEAIVGVIVIIFSVTLVQFFGSDILKIPGFGS